MPVLEKQRHELFCIGVAKGISPTVSYLEQYPNAKGAAGSAFRLLQKAVIKQRVAELQEQVARRMRGEPDITRIEIAIHERDGQVRAKWERYKKLCVVLEERAAHYSDPANEMVRRLTGTKQGEMPDLRKLPGIRTGTQIIEMRLLGKTAVPVLKTDIPLLRELSALEGEIAQLMGFLKPVTINVDNRNQTQINNAGPTVQIVKMVSSPADENGQW